MKKIIIILITFVFNCCDKNEVNSYCYKCDIRKEVTMSWAIGNKIRLGLPFTSDTMKYICIDTLSNGKDVEALWNDSVIVTDGTVTTKIIQKARCVMN